MGGRGWTWVGVGGEWVGRGWRVGWAWVGVGGCGWWGGYGVWRGRGWAWGCVGGDLLKVVVSRSEIDIQVPRYTSEI